MVISLAEAAEAAKLPAISRAYLWDLSTNIRSAFDRLHHMCSYIQEPRDNSGAVPPRGVLSVQKFLLIHTGLTVKLLKTSEFSSRHELFIRMSEMGYYLRLGEANNY